MHPPLFTLTVTASFRPSSFLTFYNNSILRGLSNYSHPPTASSYTWNGVQYSRTKLKTLISLLLSSHRPCYAPMDRRPVPECTLSIPGPGTATPLLLLPQVSSPWRCCSRATPSSLPDPSVWDLFLPYHLSAPFAFLYRSTRLITVWFSISSAV